MNLSSSQQTIADVMSTADLGSLAIIDCETTGTNPNRDRITEIAVLLIDNGVQTAKRSWLVNPERSIPLQVQQLTGITERAVSHAPSFSDIAGEVLELLEGRVLVAHNAKFDYGFLRNEFARVDVTYTSKLLCSLRLSRLLFPHFSRHRLSDIVTRFNLPVDTAHRAADDAMAVWMFLQRCADTTPSAEFQAACNSLLKRANVPANLPLAMIDQLPTAPGVYRFYDDADVLLYVGKSVNLRQRVMSHFSGDHRNAKDARINARLRRVEFTRTPTDFGAQLLESQQIKTLAPVFNRQLRRVKQIYQLQPENDSDGFATVRIDNAGKNVQTRSESLGAGLFRSRAQAKQCLMRLADEYTLCHQLLGLERRTSSGCFRAQLGRCNGACRGDESPEHYNARFNDAFASMIFIPWPWAGAVLIEEVDEVGFRHYHLIEDWVYWGRIHSDSMLSRYGVEVEDQSTELNFSVPDQTSLDTQQNGQGTTRRFDLDMYLILSRFLAPPDTLHERGLRAVKLKRTQI